MATPSQPNNIPQPPPYLLQQFDTLALELSYYLSKPTNQREAASFLLLSYAETLIKTDPTHILFFFDYFTPILDGSSNALGKERLQRLGVSFIAFTKFFSQQLLPIVQVATTKFSRAHDDIAEDSSNDLSFSAQSMEIDQNDPNVLLPHDDQLLHNNLETDANTPSSPSILPSTTLTTSTTSTSTKASKPYSYIPHHATTQSPIQYISIFTKHQFSEHLIQLSTFFRQWRKFSTLLSVQPIFTHIEKLQQEEYAADQVQPHEPTLLTQFFNQTQYSKNFSLLSHPFSHSLQPSLSLSKILNKTSIPRDIYDKELKRQRLENEQNNKNDKNDKIDKIDKIEKKLQHVEKNIQNDQNLPTGSHLTEIVDPDPNRYMQRQFDQSGTQTRLSKLIQIAAFTRAAEPSHIIHMSSHYNTTTDPFYPSSYVTPQAVSTLNIISQPLLPYCSSDRLEKKSAKSSANRKSMKNGNIGHTQRPLHEHVNNMIDGEAMDDMDDIDHGLPISQSTAATAATTATSTVPLSTSPTFPSKPTSINSSTRFNAFPLNKDPIELQLRTEKFKQHQIDQHSTNLSFLPRFSSTIHLHNHRGLPQPNIQLPEHTFLDIFYSLPNWMSTSYVHQLHSNTFTTSQYDDLIAVLTAMCFQGKFSFFSNFFTIATNLYQSFISEIYTTYITLFQHVVYTKQQYEILTTKLHSELTDLKEKRELLSRSIHPSSQIALIEHNEKNQHNIQSDEKDQNDQNDDKIHVSTNMDDNDVPSHHIPTSPSLTSSNFSTPSYQDGISLEFVESRIQDVLIKLAQVPEVSSLSDLIIPLKCQGCAYEWSKMWSENGYLYKELLTLDTYYRYKTAQDRISFIFMSYPSDDIIMSQDIENNAQNDQIDENNPHKFVYPPQPTPFHLNLEFLHQLSQSDAQHSFLPVSHTISAQYTQPMDAQWYYTQTKAVLDQYNVQLHTCATPLFSILSTPEPQITLQQCPPNISQRISLDYDPAASIPAQNYEKSKKAQNSTSCDNSREIIFEPENLSDAFSFFPPTIDIVPQTVKDTNQDINSFLNNPFSANPTPSGPNTGPNDARPARIPIISPKSHTTNQFAHLTQPPEHVIENTTLNQLKPKPFNVLVNYFEKSQQTGYPTQSDKGEKVDQKDKNINTSTTHPSKSHPSSSSPHHQQIPSQPKIIQLSRSKQSNYAFYHEFKNVVTLFKLSLGLKVHIPTLYSFSQFQSMYERERDKEQIHGKDSKDGKDGKDRKDRKDLPHSSQVTNGNTNSNTNSDIPYTASPGTKSTRSSTSSPSPSHFLTSNIEATVIEFSKYLKVLSPQVVLQQFYNSLQDHHTNTQTALSTQQQRTGRLYGSNQSDARSSRDQDQRGDYLPNKPYTSHNDLNKNNPPSQKNSTLSLIDSQPFHYSAILSMLQNFISKQAYRSVSDSLVFTMLYLSFHRHFVTQYESVNNSLYKITNSTGLNVGHPASRPAYKYSSFLVHKYKGLEQCAAIQGHLLRFSATPATLLDRHHIQSPLSAMDIPSAHIQSSTRSIHPRNNDIPTNFVLNYSNNKLAQIYHFLTSPLPPSELLLPTHQTTSSLIPKDLKNQLTMIILSWCPPLHPQIDPTITKQAFLQLSSKQQNSLIHYTLQQPQNKTWLRTFYTNTIKASLTLITLELPLFIIDFDALVRQFFPSSPLLQSVRARFLDLRNGVNIYNSLKIPFYNNKKKTIDETSVLPFVLFGNNELNAISVDWILHFFHMVASWYFCCQIKAYATRQQSDQLAWYGVQESQFSQKCTHSDINDEKMKHMGCINSMDTMTQNSTHNTISAPSTMTQNSTHNTISAPSISFSNDILDSFTPYQIPQPHVVIDAVNLQFPDYPMGPTTLYNPARTISPSASTPFALSTALTTVSSGNPPLLIPSDLPRLQNNPNLTHQHHLPRHKVIARPSMPHFVQFNHTILPIPSTTHFTHIQDYLRWNQATKLTAPPASPSTPLLSSVPSTTSTALSTASSLLPLYTFPPSHHDAFWYSKQHKQYPYRGFTPIDVETTLIDNVHNPLLFSNVSTLSSESCSTTTTSSSLLLIEPHPTLPHIIMSPYYSGNPIFSLLATPNFGRSSQIHPKMTHEVQNDQNGQNGLNSTSFLHLDQVSPHAIKRTSQIIPQVDQDDFYTDTYSFSFFIQSNVDFFEHVEKMRKNVIYHRYGYWNTSPTTFLKHQQLRHSYHRQKINATTSSLSGGSSSFHQSSSFTPFSSSSSFKTFTPSIPTISTFTQSYNWSQNHYIKTTIPFLPPVLRTSNGEAGFSENDYKTCAKPAIMLENSFTTPQSYITFTNDFKRIQTAQRLNSRVQNRLTGTKGTLIGNTSKSSTTNMMTDSATDNIEDNTEETDGWMDDYLSTEFCPKLTSYDTANDKDVTQQQTIPSQLLYAAHPLFTSTYYTYFGHLDTMYTSDDDRNEYKQLTFMIILLHFIFGLKTQQFSEILSLFNQHVSPSPLPSPVTSSSSSSLLTSNGTFGNMDISSTMYLNQFAASPPTRDSPPVNSANIGFGSQTQANTTFVSPLSQHQSCLNQQQQQLSLSQCPYFTANQQSLITDDPFILSQIYPTTILPSVHNNSFNAWSNLLHNWTEPTHLENAIHELHHPLNPHVIQAKHPVTVHTTSSSLVNYPYQPASKIVQPRDQLTAYYTTPGLRSGFIGNSILDLIEQSLAELNQARPLSHSSSSSLTNYRSQEYYRSRNLNMSSEEVKTNLYRQELMDNLLPGRMKFYSNDALPILHSKWLLLGISIENANISHFFTTMLGQGKENSLGYYKQIHNIHNSIKQWADEFIATLSTQMPNTKPLLHFRTHFDKTKMLFESQYVDLTKDLLKNDSSQPNNLNLGQNPQNGSKNSTTLIKELETLKTTMYLDHHLNTLLYTPSSIILPTLAEMIYTSAVVNQNDAISLFAENSQAITLASTQLDMMMAIKDSITSINNTDNHDTIPVSSSNTDINENHVNRPTSTTNSTTLLSINNNKNISDTIIISSVQLQINMMKKKYGIINTPLLRDIVLYPLTSASLYEYNSQKKLDLVSSTQSLNSIISPVTFSSNTNDTVMMDSIDDQNDEDDEEIGKFAHRVAQAQTITYPLFTSNPDLIYGCHFDHFSIISPLAAGHTPYFHHLEKKGKSSSLFSTNTNTNITSSLTGYTTNSAAVVKDSTALTIQDIFSMRQPLSTLFSLSDKTFSPTPPVHHPQFYIDNYKYNCFEYFAESTETKTYPHLLPLNLSTHHNLTINSQYYNFINLQRFYASLNRDQYHSGKKHRPLVLTDNYTILYLNAMARNISRSSNPYSVYSSLIPPPPSSRQHHQQHNKIELDQAGPIGNLAIDKFSNTTHFLNDTTLLPSSSLNSHGKLFKDSFSRNFTYHPSFAASSVPSSLNQPSSGQFSRTYPYQANVDDIIFKLYTQSPLFTFPSTSSTQQSLTGQQRNYEGDRYNHEPVIENGVNSPRFTIPVALYQDLTRISPNSSSSSDTASILNEQLDKLLIHTHHISEQCDDYVRLPIISQPQYVLKDLITAPYFIDQHDLFIECDLMLQRISSPATSSSGSSSTPALNKATSEIISIDTVSGIYLQKFKSLQDK